MTTTQNIVVTHEYFDAFKYPENRPEIEPFYA